MLLFYSHAKANALPLHNEKMTRSIFLCGRFSNVVKELWGTNSYSSSSKPSVLSLQLQVFKMDISIMRWFFKIIEFYKYAFSPLDHKGSIYYVKGSILFCDSFQCFSSRKKTICVCVHSQPLVSSFLAIGYQSLL